MLQFSCKNPNPLVCFSFKLMASVVSFSVFVVFLWCICRIPLDNRDTLFHSFSLFLGAQTEEGIHLTK